MQARSPKRRAPLGTVVLNSKTPALTARLFLEKFYPAERFTLSHGAFGYRLGTGGFATSRIAKQDLTAQIFKFLDSAVDQNGNIFNTTPSRLANVLWALTHQIHRVHIPLPSSDGGGNVPRYD